jgi:Tol biopolymer transport system component
LTDFKNQESYYSSWSPDGQQIAYFWLGYDKGQYNMIGIRVVDVKKAISRDLFISDYDEGDWIELGNWSSDGKYIYATFGFWSEPKIQIVRVSTIDGKIDVLKTLDLSYMGGKPYVSPDNRYLAYDFPDNNASGNSDIFLLSLENGQESVLIKHPAHDYILGWTPDGKNVMFASDRSGTVDAMLIALEGGKPVGNPISIKQNIGMIVPIGFTLDGSFYYGEWPGRDNIYFAKIDIEDARLLSTPAPLVKKFVGWNLTMDYSNNGKYLAYISRRGVMNRGKPGLVLCIRNLDNGEENEIILDHKIWGSASNPQWSPDDRSIALVCVNMDDYSRIYQYDIQTKKLKPLVAESEGQPSDINFTYPKWSKDGKSIFYLEMSMFSRTSSIMVRNIATGVENELFKYSSDDFMDRLFNISISSDGKWLAAINRGDDRIVRLISTDGCEIRELYKFKYPGDYPCASVWSKDGKYIIFPYRENESSEPPLAWNFMRIALDGVESMLIKMNNIIGLSSPSLHPDGQTLAFRTAGYSYPEYNIWEMKNFLPFENDMQENVLGKKE